MSVSSKAGAWVSGAVISLMAFSASARAEVLFDSLNSPTLAVLNPGPFFLPLDASFATGASTFHATDVALLLNQLVGAAMPGDDFTVSLEGGVPLADLIFDPVLGLT
jgi:hypothetical protein